MFNKFDEFQNGKITAMDIYSPTPKIKIKRWHSKVCSACIHKTHDYGEYDNTGWWECDKGQRLGNLNSFPFCNARTCNDFSANRVVNHQSDYWSQLEYFEKAFSEDKRFYAISNWLDFNERMGNYKVGRIY